MVMVKPALPYLDVLRAGRATPSTCRSRRTRSAASTRWSRRPPANGWIDRERAILETLTSIKRAGASMILTYWALDAIRLLG